MREYGLAGDRGAVDAPSPPTCSSRAAGSAETRDAAGVQVPAPSASGAHAAYLLY